MILCHSERSEESMKRTEQRVHRIDKFILFCCSVFKQLLDILLVLFIYCSFGPKRTKRPGTREKSSQAPFCSCRVASTQPGTWLPLQVSVCFQGAAELVPLGYIGKIIPSLHSDILAQWPENKRPCVGFLTVPVVLELPFYVTMRTNVQPYD